VAAELDSCTDIELIDSAKGGNALAFAVLYDRYADRVYRHVTYRIGPRPECDDITQQTFLKAWQAIPRYRVTDVPFVAWLLTIAHNLVVSYYRSKRDHEPITPDFQKPDDNADPQAEVEQRDRQMAVRLAIGRLKPEFQQVVAMRYLEELDYPHIAQQIGKKEATVRVILHRALQQLRRELPELL